MPTYRNGDPRPDPRLCLGAGQSPAWQVGSSPGAPLLERCPRYLGRGSWLARRDPRVLILVVVLYIFTVLQVWDLRFVLLLLLLAVGYYLTASIPWRHIRRNWVVAFSFIGTLVVVNAILGGGVTSEVSIAEAHVLFRLPLIGTPMSAESITLAVTLFVRYLAMATIGFPVAFAIAPNDFGVAFHRLGVPEKFAFGST